MSHERLTEDQVTRIAHIGATSLWAIPEGSWLATTRDASGTVWIEVVEPEPSGLMAFDLGGVRG